MLVEIAIGDAYGRPFEFASREFIEANNEMRKYVNREGENFECGIYTDDTQMSLALCECLISKGKKASTHKGLSGTFAAHSVRATISL